jgi:nucleotide-binding universal stress UspA family protein
MRQIKKILVSVDRSAMSEEVLKRAFDIAQSKKAQLVITHVIETPFFDSILSKPIDTTKTKQEFMKQIERVAQNRGVSYILFVESGSIVDAVRLWTKKVKPDFIIIGSHGQNDIGSTHFGSTTLKLIQKTRTPVLIVKNRVTDSYRSIIAPTNLCDYSKESILFSNLLFYGVDKKYLYAYKTISEFQAISYHISAEEAKELKRKMGYNAKLEIDNFIKETGSGEVELLEYTAAVNEDLLLYIKNDRADLLVLGSKGVDNLNSFVFGSTASYLAQRATCDVLVYVPIMESPSRKAPDKKTKEPVSSVQKDLDSRKDEIRDELESLFKENIRVANWSTPEASNREISERLAVFLKEKLDDIEQDIKSGKYDEKSVDFW